jgi:nucleotide-binding universal stress UspA family protein
VLVLAVAAAWITLAAVATTVMHRRGHDAFSWAVVFVFLGPLAIPIAVGADRHPPSERGVADRDGELDVLVGHDGSRSAADALDSVVQLMGLRMTSLTLAGVVDYEAATTVRGHDTEREIQAELQAAAEAVNSVAGGRVDTLVLHGDPVHALAACASEHGYELIVVGGSGPGGPRVRRGSVARRLAAGTTVPVFVGPVRR